MDKFPNAFSADVQLHTQIENILADDDEDAPLAPINDDAASFASNKENIGQSQPPPQKSVTIEQQIVELRKQLTESQAIFAEARDALANISFRGIGKHIRRQSDMAIDAAVRQFESELQSADVPPSQRSADASNAARTPSKRLAEDILDGAEASASYLNAMKHDVVNVPQLATFFRVVGRLRTAIERMERSQQMWSILDANVQRVMLAEADFVRDTRAAVAEAMRRADLSEAERERLRRQIAEDIAADERI